MEPLRMIQHRPKNIIKEFLTRYGAYIMLSKKMHIQDEMFVMPLCLP